jgi:hypothetical protein
LFNSPLSSVFAFAGNLYTTGVKDVTFISGMLILETIIKQGKLNQQVNLELFISGFFCDEHS